MEAAFPLAAFKWQQDLAATVQIAEPFRIFRVLEMAPDIFMYSLEPFQALRIPSQLIALQGGNQCLDVHPPELLVPFQLLWREALAVEKVIYSAIFGNDAKNSW